MVHGGPDNYQVLQKSLTYRLDDLAEHAVRLGVISSIDRSGEILIFENFGDSLGRGTIALGGWGAESDISSVKFRNGGFSLKMKSGNDTRSYVIYGLNTPYPSLSNYGLEAWFYLDSNVDFCRLSLSYYDGVYSNEYIINFNIVDENIKIFDSDGNWQDVDISFKYASVNQPFIGVKLTVDLVNGIFKQLKILNTVYDISSYSAYRTLDATIKSILANFRVNSVDGEYGIIYLDNMIITQNEP